MEKYTYWRNPTKEEIKFGHGAIHYRDFDRSECFNNEGSFKIKFYSKDDGLKYYSTYDDNYKRWSRQIKIPIQAHGISV